MAEPETQHGRGGGLTRRHFLAAGALGLAGTAGARWLFDANEAGQRAAVWLGRAEHYQLELGELIARGLAELGIGAGQVQGKRVLLKPNLVEPHAGAGHINTHPLVVRGAIEAFLRLGARQVLVAEGQGHRRDSLLVLEESGLAEVLLEDDIPYLDLNHEPLVTLPNAGTGEPLTELSFPRVLREVDWVVSLAKLKTHHWAGATLSMKNLFGVMPGRVYGWPKNTLHWAGIDRSIYDIAATLRPQLAIVDGIVGMEGDGPILGTPKPAGVLAMGTNLPALDATCCRVMGIDPLALPYLAASSGRLGPVRGRNIEQRGEAPERMRSDFRLIDTIPAHQGIRLAPA